MSKLKAWEGAIAVVPSRFDGFIVSPEFPTFRTRDDLDPAYLGLLCSQPWFWQLLQDQSQGMGGRRERVHPRRFLEVRVPLPPIPEQRRVVDLISAVDTVIDAASTVMPAAKSLLVAHLRSAFSGEDTPTTALGNLVEMRSGPSWKAMQESSIPSDDSMPVLKITNTRPDGTLDTTERAFVAGLPSSTMLLTESSLVMIRTNGNRDRIGNIYRANSVVVGCAVSAFQIAINPRDPADTEYIYYFLLGEPVQATISREASGSTGLANIAVSWLRTLKVPWLPANERHIVIEVATALSEVIDKARASLKASQRVRESLLSELLTGEQAIPHSYSSRVEEVG